jgi:peptidyl-tRNA hydrolase, PTH1 family
LWIVAGLGNPGRRYSKTRHNVGFMIADAIADEFGIELKKRESCMVGAGSIEDNEVVLMKPLKFMNRSGFAVKDLMEQYHVPHERLIVLHDDIDMETGKLKIRRRGSSGGHKGIESILYSIGTGDFVRVKIGIGREEGIPVEDYVLSKFRRDEIPVIHETIRKASEAVVAIISDGVDKAMNSFN